MTRENRTERITPYYMKPIKSVLLLLFLLLIPSLLLGQESEKKDPINSRLASAEKSEGFFTFYNTGDKLYMAIYPDQLDQEFLLNYQIDQGIGSSGLFSGTMLGGFEADVAALRRVDNKIYLVKRPHRYHAEEGTPQERAVDRNYSESILEVAEITAINSQGVMIIDVYDWFVGDLSNIGARVRQAVSNRTTFDKSRSYLSEVRSFPDNTNIRATLTFRNQESTAPRSVPDHRFVPVSVFYSLARLPEEPMKPRPADDRVGFFVTARKDFSSPGGEVFQRFVNRWRLECAGPTDEKGLCEPKKPIVYYLEDTIPERYRLPMMEGIEAWNAAFEEAGFRNAIRAEMLPDSADAGDIRYPTLRWNVSDQPAYGAIGPYVVDPRTGEILDADLLFEASLFRGFNETYRDLIDPQRAIQEIYSDDLTELQAMAMGAMTDGFYTELGTQANLMRAALLATGKMKSGEPLPEDYVNQAVRWVTMHEVGHTLGLRHNFRSSTDTPIDKLHDREWTSRRGVYSSVMDYPSPNIANTGVENGLYYNKGVGTYDRWAISYGYTPSEEKASEIARRAAEPGHSYGTDEDARGPGAIDPEVNTYSLGADPLAWGRDRADLIRGMIPELPEIALADNMPYYEVSDLFQSIFFQYARALAPTVKYIGGQYQYRDHYGDPDGRRPFEPVSREKQLEALHTIIEYAFSEDAVAVPQEVYQQFGANRWNHWGNSNTWNGRIDYPIHQTLLGIQKSLLDQLLHPSRLERIRDTELKFGPEHTLSIPELMETLSGEIWSEVWRAPGRDISSTRRDLQRAHLDSMIRILTRAPAGMPSDARAVARITLMDLLNRLDRRLERPGHEFDAYSRAHLIESRERIGRALEAGFDLVN